MDLSLSQIISSVGTSVQKASHTLERTAVELYFQSGYEQQSDNKVRLALTETLSLPSNPGSDAERKMLEVPLTALYSHNTMTLSKVDVSMRVKPYEKSGEIFYSIGPNNPKDNPEDNEYTELSLSFEMSEPPEGVARMVKIPF